MDVQLARGRRDLPWWRSHASSVLSRRSRASGVRSASGARRSAASSLEQLGVGVEHERAELLLREEQPVAGQHAVAGERDAARRAGPAAPGLRPRDRRPERGAAPLERARDALDAARGVDVADERAGELVDARADRALADDRREALGVAMVGGDRRQAPRQRPAGARPPRPGASGSPATSRRTSAWRSRARSPALAACALA